MIGDTLIHGRRITTTAQLLERVAADHVEVDRLVVRQPKYTEASWATALRRTKADLGPKLSDFIVILRKAAG